MRVSFRWLRDNLGQGVWADNPAIEGLPQAVVFHAGNRIGVVSDIQETGYRECYCVWLLGEDEPIEVCDVSRWTLVLEPSSAIKSGTI